MIYRKVPLNASDLFKLAQTHYPRVANDAIQSIDKSEHRTGADNYRGIVVETHSDRRCSTNSGGTCGPRLLERAAGADNMCTSESENPHSLKTDTRRNARHEDRLIPKINSAGYLLGRAAFRESAHRHSRWSIDKCRCRF